MCLHDMMVVQPILMPEPTETTILNRLIKVLVALLQADIATLVTSGLHLLRQIMPFDLQPGLYEVLEHEGTLELLDAQGSVALYRKRQKVRFLQDHIIAYQDKAWGDGEIFAHYRCVPSVPVDRYREGHYYRVLISLRQTKNRGDVEEFHIERTIRDGFVREVEDLQTEIDHRTQQLTIRVIFPAARCPKAVSVIEQKRARTIRLGPQALQTLPDGRTQVTWKTDKVKVYEAYVLRWEW
jgi:hypothetical protein